LLEDLPCPTAVDSAGRLKKHAASATRMDRLGYTKADQASAFRGVEAHPCWIMDENGATWTFAHELF